MASVQTAAAMPEAARLWDSPMDCDWKTHQFGNVVLTACGDLEPPDFENLVCPNSRNQAFQIQRCVFILSW